MSYRRFGLMIATSTAAMLVLMYLNTYAWEHVFFSETRLYMAVLMGATMATVMLVYMREMYARKRVNVAIVVRALEEGSEEADLVFELEQGLRIGYRGSWECPG